MAEERIRYIDEGDNKRLIVCVPYGNMLAVYRQAPRDSIAKLPVRAPGVPGDDAEYFQVPNTYTDEQIKFCVHCFEQGHAAGWVAGQWKLRKDLRELIGAREL